MDGEMGDSGKLTGELGAVPLIELQSGPEPHVDSMGSETPLQRMVGELGVDVGELGVDGPSRSVSMVEPNKRICMTAPCKPKNIQRGWEESTQTCMPVLAPL